MTGEMLVLTAGLPVAAALTGLAFGLVYFAALRRTVDFFAVQLNWIGLVALTLARIAIAVIPFAIAARLGAAPLLAVFVGFLLARTVVLRLVRRGG